MKDNRLFVKNYKDQRLQLSKKIFETQYPLILNEIEDYNSKFNLQSNSFQQSVYNWLNEIQLQPVCPITGEYVNFNKNTFKYKTFKGKGTRSKEIQDRITTKRLQKINYKELLNIKRTTNMVEISIEDLHKLLLREFTPITNFGGFCTKFLSRYPQYYNYVNSENFLSDCKSFQEKIYLIINNIKEIPICSYDNQSKCNFLGFTKGYSMYGPNYRKARKGKRIENLNKVTTILSKEDTIEQLKLIMDSIKNDGLSNRNLYQSICARDLILAKSILEHTSQYSNMKFSNRIYLILNGDPVVDKSYIKPVFYSLEKGYDMRFEHSRGKSKPEKELLDWLSEYVSDLTASDRSILNDKEIDIYSDRYKIGIEFNGIYWHNYEFVGKNSMINKTLLAKSKGVKLLHILETEWYNKKEIVKSIILSKFGIYNKKIFARKCEVRVLDSKTCTMFLEENHLQGKDNSKIKLGLYYNEELLSVMTFGCRKITGNNDMELIRFCNKLNTTVIGGASKLFSYFLSNHNVDKIKTYANLRLSNGELYSKMGFKFSHQSEPNYWYFKPQSPSKMELKHRSGFQKHKLSTILENYDSSKTEWENMKTHGYYKIYDCGNLIFEYKT